MPELTLPAATIGALAKFLAQWIRGLRRASVERQTQCVNAINSVISAARRTRAYVRQRDEGQVDPGAEADLAVMWTDLGHELDALKVPKLAKRCDVKGRYWAAPQSFSEDWLADADIELDSVEQLARRLKAEIQANGAP